jgi:NitT/TauT family transport system permease protein
MTAAARPEIIQSSVNTEASGIAQRPLSAWERLTGLDWLRKLVVLLILVGIWEVYGRWLDSPLLFPPFSAAAASLIQGMLSGQIPARVLTSLSVLLGGYLIGVIGAAVLTLLAISTRMGRDLLELLTSMFNPLPAIALLPLSLIWFGLGPGSIVFVTVHSVIWAVSLNTYSGFRSVSPTLRMVGRNYGLRGLRYAFFILVPAAAPSILTGLKIGWAFAWRTLIAAELVFGVSAGSGGLGWFIFEKKNLLDIPAVFAGLLTVILIGLVVENVVFRLIERRTVQRWGMQA